MPTKEQITSSLYNKRIYSARNMKSLGRIRSFVFVKIDGDNGEKYDELVGYQIKRPDLLWMFHRKPGYISAPEVGESSKGLLCVNSKNNLYKKKDIIPKTNIIWKDAEIVPLESIAPEVAKNIAKKAVEKGAPAAKEAAKKAGETAVDNLQAHSDSLHDMFSDFKLAYEKGRNEED